MDGTQRDARSAPELVRAVAAYGLPDVDLALPREPLEDAEFGEVLAHVRDGRVVALLAHAAADGGFPLTAAQAEDVDALRGAARAFVAVLEQAVVDVTAHLDDAGVETRVLKGAALAHLDYADPSWRTYGDVDLLVRGADLDRAVATLRHDGYERRLPPLRPGFDARFGKGVTLTDARGPATEVDLHRTFADGPFGASSRPDELFTGSQSFVLNGRVVDALTPADRLLHACFHVALSAHVRLSSVRDLAQLLLVTGPDPDAVLARAREWSAEAAVARGIALTWQVLGLDDDVRHPLRDWSRSYVVDSASGRALAAYVGPRAGWRAKARATARALGPLERVAYLRAVLWPSREFLEARGVTRRERWRRAAGALRAGERA